MRGAGSCGRSTSGRGWLTLSIAGRLESIYPSPEFKALEEAVVTRRCLQIAYESHGETVQGFLVLPSSPGGVWPAIVYARGGNRDFGSIGIDALLDFLTLADAGYVVIATQYRGGPGSGGNDEFGGRDVDDLLNLVPLLESRADVDPGNLRVWCIPRRNDDDARRPTGVRPSRRRLTRADARPERVSAPAPGHARDFRRTDA
jgi:hypothetical protein